MNDENLLEHYCTLLSDVTTMENQGLCSRGVMDFYLGSSVPEAQLKLYRPLLLENTALLCLLLKDPELEEGISSQSDEIAQDLGYNMQGFIAKRKGLYEESGDIRKAYRRLCLFASNTFANAVDLGQEDDDSYEADNLNNAIRAITTAFDNIYRGLIS